MRAGPLPRALVVALAISILLAVSVTTSGAQASTRGESDVSRTTADVPLDPTLFDFHAIHTNGLPIVPGQPFYLQVRRTGPAGPIRFVEVDGLSLVELGAAPWQDGGSVNGVQIYDATLQVSAPGAGSHTYQAIIEPSDPNDGLTLSMTLDVQPVAVDLAITTDVNPAQANHDIALYVEFSGAGTGLAPTGTLEWRDADTSAVITRVSAEEHVLALGTLPIGVRHFLVVYSGDIDHASATSPVFTLTVAPDAVQAIGVGRQYSTFYPVKDSYRDTVAIKGVREEPLSVAIRIYNKAGKRVRSASIALADGAYSYKWNGRTSGGSVLAAGKYKVVQTLTDAFGSKQAYTSYVNVSHKRLVTHTKYVTKQGSSITVKGHGGSGSVKISTAGGYARLKAGSGWALAGWEFTIPSATVYKSVAFQVYAKTPLSVPPTFMGIQDFGLCPRTSGDWLESCFDHWRSIGNATISPAWYSKTSKSSASRSGRHVRGIVDVSYGTTYVYKARVKVVYATLQ